MMNGKILINVQRLCSLLLAGLLVTRQRLVCHSGAKAGENTQAVFCNAEQGRSQVGCSATEEDDAG